MTQQEVEMSNFPQFSAALKAHIDELSNGRRLYSTGVSGAEVWTEYNRILTELGHNAVFRTNPEHECSSCRSFVRKMGNAVVHIDNRPVTIWSRHDEFPAPYNEVARRLDTYVKNAAVADILLSDSTKIGCASNVEETESGLITWHHMHCVLPHSAVVRRKDEIPGKMAMVRDDKQVFKRSLEELTLDAANTVLDLIAEGNLYRGDEHLPAIRTFLAEKTKYMQLAEEEKDGYCWENCSTSPVKRIRNTALGTLLIDLSSGVEVAVAVRKFEAVMAPTNYKRPKAIVTAKMIEEAEATIVGLGLENAIGRRHARLEDVTVNNVIFADRDSQTRMKPTGVLSILKESIPAKPVSAGGAREIGIDDFISNVVPNSSRIEVLVENRHVPNLFSLVAPVDPTAERILKWDNNFSWSYNGDVADSMMKQNVKAAGGNIDAYLRFSIQWNEAGDNQNDFDAHAIEPGRNEIYYGNKGRRHPSSGLLDVDIIHPGSNQVAVENITWTNPDAMPEGEYVLIVHNFTHRGGTSGFRAEIEFGGEILTFDYDRDFRDKVEVAVLNYSRTNGITVVRSLQNTKSTREVWGLKTNQYVPVSLLMFSPNYWDGQNGVGNKHYMFVLDGCLNDGTPRGYYNEFLRAELDQHRRVFEMLGNKMRVEHSPDQLSGIGFSSTVRNTLQVLVDGTPYKIQF